MKKKPKERDWYIEAGFELRKKKHSDVWDVYEGGQLVTENWPTLEEAREDAQMMRKSRNEQAGN